MWYKIIDNLSRLADLSIYLPAVIQVSVFILWIYIIRKSKTPYKRSLGLSFFLLLISVLALVLTMTSAAKVIGEYAFMFLGVGIIQIFLTKQEDS